MKIQLLKRLEELPLFTFNEFVRISGKEPVYARTILYRAKKDGQIHQVERGKYTMHEDPLVFASYIIIPSYISFWTALQFRGLTEQLPRDFMIASPRPKKPLKFAGARIAFFTNRHLWGYRKERYQGLDIFVAEAEKAIIDCFLLKNVPFEEAAKAMSDRKLNTERLIGYVERTGSGALAKRIGFLLETAGQKAGSLEKMIDGKYILLDWSGHLKGIKDRKWKIIINRRVDDIG